MCQNKRDAFYLGLRKKWKRVESLGENNLYQKGFTTLSLIAIGTQKAVS